MSIYQLYGSAGGATDDVASLDIQFDGEIVAWDIDAYAEDMAQAGDYGKAEASFLSSSCFTDNDCRGVICAGSFAFGMTTSGAAPAQCQKTLSGLRIPVVAGERLHLHIKCSGITVKARIVLYVLDNQDPRLRRRR